MTDQFEVGYALLIGINENAVTELALPDVAKDIAALRAVLVHPERCAYPEDNIKVITGSEATRQGIQDGLDWLYDKLQADGSGNTTAVIYYSGHGWQDTSSSPPTYYLIPYDMQTGRYRSRVLRAPDFADAIGEMRPRRLLVILDCCHAAGVEAKDLDVAANTYQEAAIPPHILMAGEKAVVSAAAKDISDLAQGAGRAVLSSSQGTQKSYIRQDRKMSVFTYHLIEALTGHAQPQEGAKEVLISDVMSYVTRTVPPSARREADAEQTPDFQVSGNFPVALLLGGKGLIKGEPAPDPIQNAPDTPGTGGIHQTGQTVHGPQTNITGGVQGNVYSGNIGQIGNRTVNTGGGAYIGGNVTAREFVGRDKKVVQGLSGTELERVFVPLLQAVQSAPVEKRQEAMQAVQDLKAETEKGEDADDGRMARLLDRLTDLVPGAVSAVVSAFSTPLLSGIAGPVTGFVLERLRSK